MPEGMDYALVERTVLDGLGKIFDTTPGNPDTGSYVTEATLLAWIKSKTIVTGYLYNGAWYADSGHTTPVAGVEGSIFMDLNDNSLYRYNGSEFVPLTPDLSDYATKEEVEALRQTVAKQEAEIQNLNQKAGDYTVSTYKDGDTTPTGKGEYAIVEALNGGGRIGSNLFDKTKLRVFSGSATVSDGVVSLTGNAVVDESSNLSVQAGHTYLFAFSSKSNISGTARVTNYLSIKNHTLPASSGFVQTADVFTKASAVTNTINTTVSDYVSGTAEVKDYILVDLNVYFNTFDLSFLGATDSAKLATIQQNYPKLLIPSDYGTEVVFPTYTAIKSQGVNLWDGEIKQGYYDTTDGSFVESPIWSCSENYIPVKPLTEYYVMLTTEQSSSTGAVLFFDVNKNYINSVSTPKNSSFTTPNNAHFIMFYCRNAYFNYPIQICPNSYADKTTYHPYMTDILTLPTPVTPKGAGSVSEMYYPETGRVTHPLRTITLNGSENWYEYTGAGSGYAGAALNVGELAKSRVDIINNRRFLPQATPSDSTRRGITTINSQLYVTFPTTEYATWSDFVASLASNPLVVTYALATPSPDTYVDPIPNNTLKTEGGGSLTTVQSQSPKVDGSFDIGFLTM